MGKKGFKKKVLFLLSEKKKKKKGFDLHLVLMPLPCYLRF